MLTRIAPDSRAHVPQMPQHFHFIYLDLPHLPHSICITVNWEIPRERPAKSHSHSISGAPGQSANFSLEARALVGLQDDPILISEAAGSILLRSPMDW